MKETHVYFQEENQNKYLNIKRGLEKATFHLTLKYLFSFLRGIHSKWNLHAAPVVRTFRLVDLSFESHLYLIISSRPAKDQSSRCICFVLVAVSVLLCVMLFLSFFCFFFFVLICIFISGRVSRRLQTY